MTAPTFPSPPPAPPAALSGGQIVRRRFLRHPSTLVGGTVLVALLVLVTSAIGWGPLPGWWQWAPDEITPAVPGGRPTLSLVPEVLGGEGVRLGPHPFGQTEVGHDYFARTLRGAQQTLVVVVVVGAVATGLGMLVGAVAGYHRRWVDAVLMRLTDVVLMIPVLVVGAVVGNAVGGLGVGALAVFLGLVLWTGPARVVRAEVLSVRERGFVDAARIAGAGAGWVIRRHLLPNVVGPIVVNATLLMSSAVLLETSVSYLGFGVRPPDVSLGSLISENEAAFSTRPWLFWWPGAFIVTITVAIALIGEGLRAAFDPRDTRRRRRVEPHLRPGDPAGLRTGRSAP